MENSQTTDPCPPYGQSYPYEQPTGNQYYPPQGHPHGNKVAPAPYPPPYPPYGPYSPYPPPPPPPPAPQQQSIVINNQVGVVAPVATVIIESAPYVSMAGAIALSCVVFWCCGCLFGGIGFILAMVGQCADADGDTSGAIRLRTASYGVSTAGIIAGIIFIIVIGVSV